FLIGLNGGLVAATYKTSDYYQGDEDQFMQAIGLSQGQVWMEQHVADESASAMLVKIAVPVFGRDANEVEQQAPIGVLVLGLYEFVLELYADCKVFPGAE